MQNRTHTPIHTHKSVSHVARLKNIKSLAWQAYSVGFTLKLGETKQTAIPEIQEKIALNHRATGAKEKLTRNTFLSYKLSETIDSEV